MFVRTTRSFSARPAPTLPMSLPDAADQEEEQCVRAPSRYGNCEKSKIGKEYQTDHHYNKFRGLMAKTYVVVGGSAAGPKTASKIRRLDQEAKIIMMQKGKYLSMASCGYPYFVGGVFDDPNQLISTPTGAQRNPTFFSNVKNITALTSTEVLSIDRKKKRVQARNLETGETLDQPYDRLLLATGANPIVPDLPGRDSKGVITLQSMEDAIWPQPTFCRTNAWDA
jgi:hypothetical protein